MVRVFGMLRPQSFPANPFPNVTSTGIILTALLCMAGQAQAEPAHQPGALGGGFLEMLMTGRSSGVARAAQAPTAVQQVPVVNRPLQAAPAPAQAYTPEAWVTTPQNAPRVQAGQQQASVIFSAPPANNKFAEPPSRGAGPAVAGTESRFNRQEVAYEGGHTPGTIIIDTPNKFLFLVQANGRALRYGIGVGRPGFEWAGVKHITRKAEWPDWRPPPEMLKRRPDLPRYMAGGIENPLGARALYLGSSLYRIHGTNEPQTIGRAVSSGCIRMKNDDVTDLYERVKVGTKVIVI
jgi:lipoprotein-anchoring transpeptidase ErfK/SrfK